MSNDTRHDPENTYTPVQTAIFLAVLISGFLLVHFGVARLW
jgi:hypothetical protein